MTSPACEDLPHLNPARKEQHATDTPSAEMGA